MLMNVAYLTLQVLGRRKACFHSTIKASSLLDSIFKGFNLFIICQVHPCNIKCKLEKYWLYTEIYFEIIVSNLFIHYYLSDFFV